MLKTSSLDMITEVAVISDINDVFNEDLDTDLDVSVEKTGLDSNGNSVLLCEVENVEYYAIVIDPYRHRDQEVKSVFSRKSDALRDFKNMTKKGNTMRRTASEVIRNLEMRIARLEKQSASKEMRMIESLQKSVEQQVSELDRKTDSFQSNTKVISDEDLLNPLLGHLDNHLLHLSDNGRGLSDEVEKLFRQLKEVQRQIDDANALVKEIEDNL